MNEPQVSLVRPFDFSDTQYHIDKWKEKDITVLICHRNTNDLIRLCLESLLRFYPDIPIVVMEGGSTDDSVFYLRYKSMLHPNIKIIEGTDTTSRFTSHGVTMHEALKHHIHTKYVLLMDSDVIVERAGLIEDMLPEFNKDELLYAIGSVMLVTRSGHACGAPKNEDDVLRYAHPSFSIYDVKKYHEVGKPFTDHGAPCVYSMLEAENKGLHIVYYPVDKYVSHLSGGSWTEPRTIWANDHQVLLRPFVTFIISNPAHLEKLQLQTNHDFDIVTTGNTEKINIVVHGLHPKIVNNNLYSIRYNVCGEYVCHIPYEIEIIQEEFMRCIKNSCLENNMPDEINVGGLNLVRRTLWQNRESIQ